MNGICCIIFEGPTLSIQAITDAGLLMLFMNAAVAFCLNVAVVFLIGKTSSLVLTLSGVLKDILLVILSVLIWSTPVTALQMFGYAIALGGLIWYKIGADQAHAAYQKLTADENSPLNRFKRSLWAKIGAGVLFLFVLSAMAHGFSRGRGIDTSSSHTGLTGAPDPEMVDAYYPVESPETWGQPSPWDDTTHPTHYTNEGSAHLLDIVIYVPSASLENSTMEMVSEVLQVPLVQRSSPHIIAYSVAPLADDIIVTQSVSLASLNSASAAYLHYMSSHYENLADHTMFIHTDIEAGHIAST